EDPVPVFPAIPRAGGAAGSGAADPGRQARAAPTARPTTRAAPKAMWSMAVRTMARPRRREPGRGADNTTRTRGTEMGSVASTSSDHHEVTRVTARATTMT